MCFWGVFRCLEERKNVERSWAEGGNFRKMCLLRSRGHLGLFIDSGMNYEAAALEGLPASILSDRVKLDIFGKVLTS